MPKLSLIIITRNEEEDLGDCLESVRGLVDEIILVDNHSSDRTLEVAGRHRARIYNRALESYAAQKQYALEKAGGEWVLNLDADERVSPELKKEIQETLGYSLSANGFDIPYEVHFLSRPLRFSGVGAESHIRLFRKDRTRYIGGLLHEGAAVDPPIGRLRGKIIHRPYRNMAEYFEKLERYTTLAAQKAFQEGRRFNWCHYGIYPAEFLKRYFLQMGFLDGRAGFTWCRLSALYSWRKYRKLKSLHKE